MDEKDNNMEQEELVLKPKRKKGKGKWICFILVVMILGIGAIAAYNYMLNKDFEVSFYAIKNQKVSDNVRIVALADLHNAEFGNKNSTLVKKIESLHPDLIFYCGDMINEETSDYSGLFDLSDELNKVAPIYACFGNNELQRYLTQDKQFKNKMNEHRVNWLSNEAVEIEVRNTKIQLIAVTEGVEQFDVETNNAKKFVEALEPYDGFRICLTHYPELFQEKLLNRDIDIAFTGHAHGGLIRIPYVGGLYSPGQGVLPKWTQGVQTMKDDTQVVISRGLGNSGKWMRINNQPELVVADINWY